VRIILFWPEIDAETKQSEEVHCDGGGTSLQSFTFQIVLAIHFPAGGGRCHCNPCL
jgi:hypothetical protein